MVAKVPAAGVDLDGAVTVNESSADVDFRIESNGNTHMLFVDGGNNRVGFITAPDLGTGVHIRQADSGADVDSDANQLVIEDSDNCGLSITGDIPTDKFFMFRENTEYEEYEGDFVVKDGSWSEDGGLTWEVDE